MTLSKGFHKIVFDVRDFLFSVFQLRKLNFLTEKKNDHKKNFQRAKIRPKKTQSMLTLTRCQISKLFT